MFITVRIITGWTVFKKITIRDAHTPPPGETVGQNEI